MRWAVSWSLYWIGDAIWRVSDVVTKDEFCPVFRAYQFVMRQAHHVQGDGPGPWIKGDVSDA